LKGALSSMGCVFSLLPTGGSLGQSPPSLTRSQGEISILTCSYSATVSYVQWYRLFPGESPVFLLSLYEDGNVTHGPNFIAKLLKRERRSHLHIDGSQLADSAGYFCAVETMKQSGRPPVQNLYLQGGSVAP
uniref:Ig-like domain-containing protein n=1 Tax=Gopherus agassizii TaxID=38772 RepID=A0A452GTZ3_9SAUR